MLISPETGLGYRRDLADDFLNLPGDNVIQFIEIAPENWLKMGGKARYIFDQVAERLPLKLHGLSLSLGGQSPLDTELLTNIKIFMTQYNTTFFSEHLSFCELSGHLYDLLPLPFTEEAVKHTARRIREVQDFLGFQISLENISYYFHHTSGSMNEAEFINAVVQEADCKILLDVNNIYVNSINHNLLAPVDFIDSIDISRVNYAHIAGHEEQHPSVLSLMNSSKRSGEVCMLIDTHSESVKDDVWALLDYLYQRISVIPPTLLERDANFPPFSELYSEVECINKLQKKHANSKRIFRADR
ncbi:TPA: DUF692 domain-containing protein [Salmonella enterica]|nr:DUF692 domain-containing protein [Salmonella enterica]